MELLKKVLKWGAIGFASLFIVLFIIREFHYFDVKKTDAQIEKIHSTKLTLDDVMGKNLPPDPGLESDRTIAGVDANNNGIRDDVELAIFKEYPNSAKTRAVLLQYALALQMEITLPVLNTATATSIIEDNDSRAHVCIWSITSRSDMKKFMEITNKNEKFVEQLQFNTEERKKALDSFYKYVRSYSASNDGCDLDINILPN